MKHITSNGLSFKEDEDLYTGLVATTHPDRVNDILSVSALNQIAGFINNTDTAGQQNGSFRSVSLYHDWIKEGDPTKDEVMSLRPTAKVIRLPSGHHGVEVEAKPNNYYRGEMSIAEVKSRIDDKLIAGFSIEYDTDDAHCKTVTHNGEQYRFIEQLTQFGGVGLARARMIANPHAVVYKEIEQKAMEVKSMTTETKKVENTADTQLSTKEVELAKQVEALQTKEAELKAEVAKLTEAKVEVKETTKEEIKPALSIKEVLESKEFETLIDEKLKVKSKVLAGEGKKMDIPLSIKEMNSALANQGKKDSNWAFDFKEASSRFFTKNDAHITSQMMSNGIPLNTTLQVKCVGNKMKIVGKMGASLQTKDTLDLDTNTTALTLSIVEFADNFLPGIIESFNQLTNLFGNLDKRDHIMGGDQYGWRITTSQSTGLSVDPDDVSVTKTPVKKVKLRTGIKEYRLGVSVTDFVLHHSRASMGDLLRLEIEKTTNDLMKDLNGDLFTEQVDSGNQVLGLEAVADSAGNTTLYGLTRSTANRLAPASAGDTFQAVGGALTTALLRTAARLVEVEGARRSDLRYICNPSQRQVLFELEDGNQRYQTAAQLGFEGEISYDGVPVWVDPDCQTDAIFCVDKSVYYLVISRPPQMIGLAKVGAAEEAFVSIYVAAVYELPRRIHMLDTLTAP